MFSFARRPSAPSTNLLLLKELLDKSEIYADPSYLHSMFVDNLPRVCVLKDLNGKIVWGNSELYKILEITRLEDISMDHLSRTELDVISKMDNLVITSKKAHNFVESFHDKEGQKRKWFISKFPVFSNTGELRYVGGIAADLTNDDIRSAILEETTN